jgi:hypothetical protein
MTLVAAMLCLVLVALSALHGYWAVGGVWPGSDAASCARTVAGFKGVDRMPPPASSLAVALLLGAVAVLAVTLAGAPVPSPFAWLAPVAGAVAAIVFLARGMAGFTPAWRRLTPELPFARLDRRYYSPLCLAIGLGFAFLVLDGDY